MNSQGGHTVAYESEAFPYFCCNQQPRVASWHPGRSAYDAFFSRVEFIAAHQVFMNLHGVVIDGSANFHYVSGETFCQLKALMDAWEEAVAAERHA